MTARPSSDDPPTGEEQRSQTQQSPPTTHIKKEDAADVSASKEGEQYLSGMKLYALALALLLTVFIMTLDMSILATAIPYVTNEFDTINDIGWYGAAYLMTTAALQPLAGRIYTYFPLKYAYLAFLTIFAVGSLLCATAVSSPMLIVGRSVSGIGGSGLANGAMTIIAVESPPDRRAVLLGVLFGLTGLGQIVGPLVGGGLTEHLSWRWCFYINLPAAALTAGCLLIIRFSGHQDRKIDWTWKALVSGLDLFGFVLFAPASVMLFLALQWGGVAFAWDSATIIGLLCGAGVVIIVFVAWERHHGENAMVPPAFISRRIVAASCLTGFFQGGAMILLSYYLPLWFQVIKQVSPTDSAVRTLPIFLAQVVFIVFSTAFIQRFLYLAPPGALGQAVSTVGAGLMTTFNPGSSAGEWIGYQVLVGGGRGLGLQTPMLAIQAHCEPSKLAVGTALVVWSQFFGGAIFVALGQTALANLLRHSLTRFAPGVNQGAILEAGATNYATDIPSDQQANVLRAYNEAITQTFYLSVGASAAAVLTSVAIGRAKMKGESKKTEGSGVQEEDKSPV